MFISRLFVGALVAGCLLTAACSDPATSSVSTREIFAFVTDDSGRDVVFNDKPVRVAVTSASFLEPLHALGADIVARPASKTLTPDWAENIPPIGQVYSIDVEALLATRPDVVFLNKGMNEKLVDVLTQNGIAAVVLSFKSYEDVKRDLEIFGDVVGQPDKAKSLIADMNAQIQAVVDRAPKVHRRVAIIHSTAQGLSVQLDGSIAGSVVNLLGWFNVASGLAPMDSNPDAAPFSLESLVELNPDYLLVTSMGDVSEIKRDMEAEFRSNPAWAAIPAVKAGRVLFLPQDLFLLSPALHYPDAVAFLADSFKE